MTHYILIVAPVMALIISSKIQFIRNNGVDINEYAMFEKKSRVGIFFENFG